MGTKLGMTQIFDEKGLIVPVTVIQVGPCQVIDILPKEKHGADLVQIGFGTRKEKHLTKAQMGDFKKKNVAPVRILKASQVENTSDFKVGQTLDVSYFEGISFVDITGVTIGKGFQGVVRRYGYAGGPGGHGSNFHRRLGSAGSNTYPARVWKGKGMPGRMGGEQRTLLNLQVVKTDKENNLLLVKGAIPGNKRGVVYIRPAVKKPAKKS
jgi:large subunit ribosomal protein L3